MDESTSTAAQGGKSVRKTGDFIGAVEEKEVEKRSSLHVEL